MTDFDREEVAIVGMAGRFPGAPTVEQLWENLCAGVESIRPLTADELAAAGVDPAVAGTEDYVAAAAPLEDADAFDASFFGYTRREAEIMDPQHRVFLECSWAALEDAGYAPEAFPGRIGLFGGVAPNTYRQKILESRPDIMEMAGRYPLMIGSEREYAITRSAFKLGLQGPVLSVNTACSTSGVALHLACQSVLSGESDIALAGGARVAVPQTAGYFYEEDGILSPDGHCRAFDARGRGTVVGSGVAIVVIKRLSDALDDGDDIRAVIKGTAVNNDGDDKIGYTAPGVRGQELVIREALEMAEVDPATIGYVEAHGTGTFIGDPIEVEALSRAYRRYTDEVAYCGLGSIKTNIGHLDAGAGVAGVIKAAMALRTGVIPPSLHFEEPNPQIDFASSPFRVIDRLTEWPASPSPRRAAVSSFGLGGTNAHIILEEPPAPPAEESKREQHLFVLSAGSDEALDRATDQLATHLGAHPEVAPADVAHTLMVGRHHLRHRRAVVAKDLKGAGESLTQARGRPARPVADRPILFMFPGGGAQHVGMARNLYEREPVFRRWFDRCADLSASRMDRDVRGLVFGDSVENLDRPTYAFNTLFAAEYAMARLLESHGVKPDLLIGHSMGEYTAACLSGVLSLEDAAALVAVRAELFETVPSGAMLSIPLSPGDLEGWLNEHLSLAVINKPELCIVAGEEDAVDELEAALSREGIESRRLHLAVATHSHLLDPILDRFGAFAATIDFSPPQIPIVSNLTGEVVDPDAVTRPEYWVDHLRHTVRFVDGLRTALSGDPKLAIEVGPGQTLSGYARQHPDRAEGQIVVATLPHSSDSTPDDAFFLDALGKLWAAGAPVDLQSLYAGEQRRRVPLPTYPFERTRHWIEPGQPVASTSVATPVESASLPLPDAEQTTEPDDRPTRIFDRIVEVLGDLSGMGPEELDRHATFLELGFDSLFMTQAASALGSVFGMRISFRQLFEEAPTIDALVGWLDERVPEDALPAPVSPSTVSIPDAALGQQPDALAAITAQLGELQRQVAALGGQTASAPERTSNGHDAPTTVPAPEADGEAPAPSGPWRPPSKTTDDLTEEQRRQIVDLTDRLVARSPSSREQAQANRARLADPRTAAGFRRAWKDLVYPLVVDRSAGSKVWDIDGNEYLDIAMGFGVNLFGHSPSFVIEAVRDQLSRGIEIGPQTPLAGETAGLIADLTGHERVAFTNTGSEAVLAAMRLARTVTGRTKILTFANDYHGLFDEVLARGVTRNGTRRSVPIAPGIPSHAPQDLVIFDYGDPEALAYISEHASDLAAVLVEPVQSRHPDLQPADFLHALRESTAKTGTALVFDEMITGFRSHPGGAQALFGVKADIATYGKVIGGGFPIGVVAGDARFMDALDGGHWQYGDDSFPAADVTWFAGTFVRHPVALAASRAALLHMQASGGKLQADLNRTTTSFVEDMNGFLLEKEAPVEIEHFSSLFLTRFESDQQHAGLFYFHLRDQGIHVTEGRAAFLSTAHSESDLDHLRTAYRNSISAMLDSGLLSRRTATTGSSSSTGLPVTEGQQEILLAAAESDAANSSYNLSNTLHIRGRVDPDALTRAVNDLISHYDSLRVTFDPDLTQQRIMPRLEIDIATVDLSPLDPAVAEEALEAERIRDVETPFDLFDGPLVRARLIRMNEQDHHLFLTVHHAVCDGWSSGILLRRLADLYNAYRRSEPVSLPEAMSITEYVDWFEDYRNGPAYEEDKGFWRDHVGEEFPVTDLPTDHPRPPTKEYRSERHLHQLDGELVAQLRQIAAAEGVTMFTLLLGSFECLLARLTGTEEVGLGVSIAGQTSFPDRDLVVHAVNALPMRRPVSLEQSFADHLTATQRSFFDAFEHQNFSYGAIVRAVNTRRDSSRTPLISTTFNMDSPSKQLEMDGAVATPGSNPRRFEIFDAFVNVVPHEDHFVIECTYDTALFDAASIDRRMREWTTMLEDLVERGPTTPVGELLLIPPTEKALLESWNSTAVPGYDEQTLVSLFVEAVERWPERPAVVYGDRSLTYRELADLSMEYAQSLSRLNVSTGSTVGILCERSIEMVAAIYGTLLVGAAYVPLDPELPPGRISYMVSESEMTVVLSQRHLADLIENTDVVALDVGAIQPGGEGADISEAPVKADDAAYVLYTSGSTGRPKGVVVSHGAVANQVLWTRDQLHLGMEDRLLLTKPIVFDASILELFAAWTTGATLVIAEPGRHADPGYLVEVIQEHEVTVIQFVPTMLRMFMAETRVSECQSLRVVICGGEPLTADLRDQLHELLEVELLNHYGPTETTVVATASRYPHGDDTPITIGRPVANTQVYILDQNLTQVPIGVVGELCIGGSQVARGYLNRPELTAERFVENPQSPGTRIYRTGDLARWLANGTIEFLGRMDNQVKIRGYRVELGEIEKVLLEHPEVTAAAVLVDESGSAARIVAYVSGSASEEGLKDWARARLPGYMVPAAIGIMASIPVTVNGKVDRQALPGLEVSHPEPDRSFVAPRTPIEEEIAQIWEEVLGLTGIDVFDDFYELGGHSLTAMQANARVRSAYDVEMALSDFQSHPTINDQALLVTERLTASQMDDEMASFLEDSLLSADTNRPATEEP